MASRSTATKPARSLPGTDGRSALARRFHDIVEEIVNDMGGADNISETKLQLVRRFAAAASMAELMEANACNSHPIDIADYAALTNIMTRITARIGYRRRLPKLVIDAPANDVRKLRTPSAAEEGGR